MVGAVAKWVRGQDASSRSRCGFCVLVVMNTMSGWHWLTVVVLVCGIWLFNIGRGFGCVQGGFNLRWRWQLCAMVYGAGCVLWLMVVVVCDGFGGMSLQLREEGWSGWWWLYGINHTKWGLLYSILFLTVDFHFIYIERFRSTRCMVHLTSSSAL